MGKRGKSQQKDTRNPKRRHRDDVPEDLDDEIDTFHKQRDIIPLDVNGDSGDSDDDDEHPVFDLQGISDSDDDEDDAEAAKIVRQQQYLNAKFGGAEDEMHDEEDGDEKEEKVLRGRKEDYYGGDNRDYELQSSDDEAPREEEEEIKRMQREKAERLSKEDVIPDDFTDESESESESGSEKEPTFEEISVKGKGRKKSEDSQVFEKVKKDLSALSSEEQMDVVYSSAPELVGLLSELNVSLDELENKVNPLLRKAKEEGVPLEGGLRYLEVKQLLLLSYCQAITFYLLLKSEGQPVRDHPVLNRIVEIQGLLDKTKELDRNLPSDLEEILKNYGAENGTKSVKERAEPVSPKKVTGPSLAADEPVAKPQEMSNVANEETTKERDNKKAKPKNQNDKVGHESKEMLKIRAALAEKLKQKGVLNSITSKPDKPKRRAKLLNGQLETRDDFDDDAMNAERGNNSLSNGHESSVLSSKLSQLATLKRNKAKIISGDDDLPKRDDIGERRRKHELRVLAGAGMNSEGDAGDELPTIQEDGSTDSEDGDDMDDVEDGDTPDSDDDDLYNKVKQHRAAKLAAKAEIYSRTTPETSSLPEETADGKRLITYQMEKNRGLTRSRKKQDKNPRKKYRQKHQKAVTRRKGQVRDIRKQQGPYGGESTGINVGISRSIRFKN